jgi:hypothetical protein
LFLFRQQTAYFPGFLHVSRHHLIYIPFRPTFEEGG